MRARLLLVGLLWVAISFGLIFIKEYSLRTGTEVILETLPVDPRELFRGDYVVLRYKISEFRLNEIKHENIDFVKLKNIYVLLGNKKDNVYFPLEIRSTKPKNGELFIRGRVNYFSPGYYGSPSTVSLKYGIESFFVPEGKGRELEQYRGKGLKAKVVLDKNGESILKSLLIDSSEVRF